MGRKPHREGGSSQMKIYDRAANHIFHINGNLQISMFAAGFIGIFLLQRSYSLIFCLENFYHYSWKLIFSPATKNNKRDGNLCATRELFLKTFSLPSYEGNMGKY